MQIIINKKYKIHFKIHLQRLDNYQIFQCKTIKVCQYSIMTNKKYVL